MISTVVWGTGNVGRAAIRPVDAHPTLELAAVVVDKKDKVGRDAGELGGLGRGLGLAATAEALGRTKAVEHLDAQAARYEQMGPPKAIHDHVYVMALRAITIVAYMVEVEHVLDDGCMIPVRVAGTLDEARLTGFQHPNCRHSMSAYTPGLTRVGAAESDPGGYEAGLRQRAIERRIRHDKRREAAAITPEAQRAARLQVRQWQGTMRDHLTAHPDLRRLRHREQPGASNLPEPRREATPEQVDAARPWSGDAATAPEMDDEQRAAAMRSDVLDERSRARVEGEADRCDLDDRAACVATGCGSGGR